MNQHALCLGTLTGMAELPPGAAEIAVEVERIGASPGDVGERVPELLDVLHGLVPFQASALYVLDPERGEFEPVSDRGYSETAAAYMRTPEHYREMELLGMHRDRAPMCVRDTPMPPGELPSWAEHLEPAGFREGIGVGLFSPDGHQLGMLTLHTDTVAHPTDAARDFLGLLAPLIAEAVDPMRSIATLAGMVGDARAGCILTRAGNLLPLPGLPSHPLLHPGAPLLRVAAESLADGRVHATFLCPYQPDDGPDGHVRITLLPCPYSSPPHLLAVVLVSPPGDLRGLTWRELEILGLLVEGWSNQRIASGLVIALRTVAAHVEHVLTKLAAPGRTLAAVRALRLGLYVPRALARVRR
ncbi:LuxR C-terminal-related transcriptional regulator [Plantactinospora sp. CA-290183]|uniref:LuxR C-terminal-related transcriptional regulator n=1 Tax=Plantactinospora sp. CA-290183 TaxID=3240006 RepID=UPI003D8BA4F3